MEQDTDNFSTDKPKIPRRKLTAFLCREMLFDYATERLDAARKKDVDDFLKGDVATRQSLTAVKRGLDYASELGKSDISSESLTRLKESENFRTVVGRAASWGEWPETVRWSVSALGISVVTAALVAYLPWNKLPAFDKKKAGNSVVLADIPQDEHLQEGTEADPDDAGESENGSGDLAANDTSGDEHADHGEESPLPHGTVVESNEDIPVIPARPAVQDVQTIRAKPAAEIAKPEKIEKEIPPKVDVTVERLEPIIVSVLSIDALLGPTPLIAAMPRPFRLPGSVSGLPKVSIAIAAAEKLPLPAPVVEQPVSKAPPVKVNEPTVPASSIDVAINATDEIKVANTDKPKKPVGFVYRVFMNLTEVQAVTPEIVTKLIDFGSEKAGEVELGWRRGEGSYFHFTVPESNEAALMDMLRTYGPVRISKDPHPRVMPEGQIRIILWIEPSAP